MNRSKDLLGMAASCVLAVAAVLAGCAQRDPTFGASLPASLSGASVTIEEASVSPDRTSPRHDESSTVSADLPVVVITGHRQLVLSERNAGPSRD